LSSVS